VKSVTLPALSTRNALAVSGKLTPILPGKAAVVPRPELPWLAKPEEQPAVMALATKMMMLKMRHMTEPEHEVAVAELEHQTALAEMTEVPRPEVWSTSEVPRSERPRLCKKTIVVELEALVSQVQIRPSVP
jgi:hypothetical protein